MSGVTTIHHFVGDQNVYQQAIKALLTTPMIVINKLSDKWDDALTNSDDEFSMHSCGGCLEQAREFASKDGHSGAYILL